MKNWLKKCLVILLCLGFACAAIACATPTDSSSGGDTVTESSPLEEGSSPEESSEDEETSSVEEESSSKEESSSGTWTPPVKQ